MVYNMYKQVYADAWAIQERRNMSVPMRKGVFMDFQAIADSYYPMASILFVENTPDGKYGAIRVVAGNQKYIDVEEHPKCEVIRGMGAASDVKFVPNGYVQ